SRPPASSSRASRRAAALAPPSGTVPRSLAGEQAEVDRVGHGLVPRVVHVQVVAGIELLLDLRGRGGIADSRIEIDDAVVRLAGSNPVVDGLALGFAFRSRIGCALERRQRG